MAQRYCVGVTIGETPAEVVYSVYEYEDDYGRRSEATELERVLLGVAPHQVEIDYLDLAVDVQRRLERLCESDAERQGTIAWQAALACAS